MLPEPNPHLSILLLLLGLRSSRLLFYMEGLTTCIPFDTSIIVIGRCVITYFMALNHVREEGQDSQERNTKLHEARNAQCMTVSRDLFSVGAIGDNHVRYIPYSMAYILRYPHGLTNKYVPIEVGHIYDDASFSKQQGLVAGIDHMFSNN